MHHHDVIFLEESPANGLQEMLQGALSIDDYLLSAEVEYPEFSRRMCRLLRKYGVRAWLVIIDWQNKCNLITNQALTPLSGIYVCGEYQSVPGIQWAMLSGRHTAEAVIKELAETHESISITQR